MSSVASCENRFEEFESVKPVVQLSESIYFPVFPAGSSKSNLNRINPHE